MKALTTIAAAFLAAVLLFGCVVVPPMQSVFYADEVAFIHERGTNTIKGNAFLRQKGGGVVSCAGSEVLLIPKGAYSTERMERLFGIATVKGYNPAGFGRRAPAAPEGFFSATRETTCDIDGKFEFKNLSAGSYFITTDVFWTASSYFSPPQGGNLMVPVTFAGNDEVRNVVVTW